MILVDTNSWVRHVRIPDPRLITILQEDRAVTCKVVMGELLLGSGVPPTLVSLLGQLPVLPSPSADETQEFIARHLRSFRSSGVGWADCQILVAAKDAGALLYSADLAVKNVWRRLGFRAG